jgi:hypothetical protein
MSILYGALEPGPVHVNYIVESGFLQDRKIFIFHKWPELEMSLILPVRWRHPTNVRAMA